METQENTNVEKIITDFIQNLNDDRFDTLVNSGKYPNKLKSKDDFINYFLFEREYKYNTFLEENKQPNIEKYIFYWEYIKKFAFRITEENFISKFIVDKNHKIKDEIRNEYCFILIEEKTNIINDKIYYVHLVYPYNCNNDEVHLLPIRNTTNSVFNNEIDFINHIAKLKVSNGYSYVNNSNE